MDFVLDKKKVFVLFIAFIMLSSIFAFVFLSAQNTNPTPSTPIPGTDSDTTGIQFSASGVKTKVQRMFPLVRIISHTTEADISAINSKIVSIEGVTKINDSGFSQDTQQPGGLSLIYVAEISVVENFNAQNAFAKLQQMQEFSSPELYQSGLVSLPQSVTFQNPDLNLSQEHVFQNPLTNAFLSVKTQKDDEITVFLQASLASNILQSLLAVEETNLSASEETISLSKSFEIKSFSQNLSTVFSATAGYMGKEKELEEELKQAFSDSNKISVQQGFFFPTLEITVSQDMNIFKTDMDTLLKDINGIDTYSVLSDQNKIIALISQQSFLQTKQKILSELESINFTVLEAKDPAIPFSVELGFPSTDLKQSSSLLKTFLEQKGFTEISVTQTGFFETENFSDPDTNIVYPFEQKSFEAQINPQHAVSDQVELEITISIVRGKIVSVSAKEKEQ